MVFNRYIQDIKSVRTIPVEYYSVKWMSFKSDYITQRSIPITTTYIDTSAIRFQNGADIYISNIIRNFLTDKEQADLRINHRLLKEKFEQETAIEKINKRLQEKAGEISDKKVTYSIDLTSRTQWENTLTAYLDEIPFHFIGRGEQNTVKIKLAIETDDSKKPNLILLEEPENHLTFANLNILLKKLIDKYIGKQIIITTHSSYVLNKLGLDNLLLLSNNKQIARLTDLDETTHKYFKKLLGYDTLRILLSKKPILVEGPSDELIVQKAYLQEYKRLPISDGIDIISVKGLAFKRFLEIAKLLKKNIIVITDNDGDLAALKNKYKQFEDANYIKIYYDEDIEYKTLESQIVKVNSVPTLNKILGTKLSNKETLIDYMTKSENKTECALKIFDSSEEINIPEYIVNAIQQ